MASTKKIFVLDTNVILHDFRSIFSFQENDIVVPIVVLEELDHFKKGNDNINFQAREFMREMDKLSENHYFTDGISLGDGLGKLFIEPGKSFPPAMQESFSENSADHKIIATAYDLRTRFPKRKVVVVTQDLNVRMKAKALGINAEDYKAGKVENIADIFKGILTLDNVSDDLVHEVYNNHDCVPIKNFPNFESLITHRYFIMKGSHSSVLAHYDPFNQVVIKIEKRKHYGIEPRNAEQTFAFDALMRPEVKLVALTGKAGTGKTLLALAAAMEQRQDFQQIYLARPIVPLGNKDIGYLPGDAKEKIEPYMQPLYDNLSVIKHKFSATSQEVKRIEEMLKTERLLISPLAYIRGRSLSQVFFIVDEAQNLTPHEVKTVITRAGEGTKMIFTGDIHQIDSPYLDNRSNGLSYLIHKMKGQKIFSHINLLKGERSFLADLAGDLL